MKEAAASSLLLITTHPQRYSAKVTIMLYIFHSGNNDAEFEIDHCAKFRYVKVEKRKSLEKSDKIVVNFDIFDNLEKGSPDQP
jgi:hypothetical protein